MIMASWGRWSYIVCFYLFMKFKIIIKKKRDSAYNLKAEYQFKLWQHVHWQMVN